MIRGKDVPSAAHILALGIIVVLSFSIIAYPIGFLASTDARTSDHGAASPATTNNSLSNTGVNDVIGIPDDSGVAQPVMVDSPNAVPSSDSSSPSDSSTDSSSDGSTTTPDSSGGSQSGGTGATGNDSSTVGTIEGSTPIENGGSVENQSSSIPELSSSSATPETEVPHQSSSLSPSLNDGTKGPESSSASLSTDTSTESVTTDSAENPNSVIQPISKGDNQIVSLGDISNTDGTSAEISLDKTSYAPGDSAEVTVQDSDANVDPKAINTIQIIVGTSRDDPTGTTLTLTETAEDSGKFTGSFSVASDPSSNHIFYDASHPRGKAVISGVNQSGAVEVQELPVSSFQTSLGEGQPDILIGNGLQVTLTDGAELASNSDCEANNLPPPCGGSTTVTLSYANAPSDLNGQPASNFTIWQHIEGGSWVNLFDYQGAGKIDVNEDAKTVTATSPFGPGVFVIGVDTGAGGGGGGAPGLPGSGLILDLVAPLVDANPEPPTTPEPSTTTPDSPTQTSVPVSTSLSTTPEKSNVTTTQESLKTAGEVSQNTGSVKVSSTGNTTIAVPGAGSVMVSFTKLVSDGALSVSAVKTPSELSALKITISQNGQGVITSLDNTHYSVAGFVFVIGPMDGQFDGTATIAIPYNATLAPQASEVRVLHYTGTSWEDVTSSPPADGHVVTGSLSTLGPVVAAVKAQ